MVKQGEQKVYEVLHRLGIKYNRYEHPPVYTVEEAKHYWQNLEGGHSKNLFLRDKKGTRHFLVILEQSKTADLKSLTKMLAASKLSFASENRLMKYLGVEAGSVSPFGLLNDAEGKVVVVLDSALQQYNIVYFHPNVNTSTISISYADFKKYLQDCGNEIMYI